MTPDEVKKRLQDHFPGDEVAVKDLTGTENHYEVSVRSGLFKGLSRIEAHQKVLGAFADELKSGEVHALSIRARE